MRRLAQGIVGLLALGIMLIAQPWSLRECAHGACPTSSDGVWYWYIFGTAIYLGMFSIILIVVLVGVLGMRAAGRVSDAAVFAALGQNQAAAARVAAATGLRDGAVVTGGAFLVSGALHVYIALSSGYTLNNDGAGLWLVRLTTAAVLTLALALAHVIDAIRPRRTPVERLHEDAAAPRPRRVSLRSRALALGAIAAVGVGMLVGIAVSHDSGRVASDTTKTIAQGAVIGLTFTGIALFFAVVVPLVRLAIRPATGAVAAVTGKVGASQASALLRARVGTSSGASARTVLAICGLALMIGALCNQDPSPALSPAYVGTITVQPADAGAGFAAERLAALPGVRKTVVAGRHGDWDAGANVAVVDPADVADVDPTLYGLLTSHPQAIITGGGEGGLTVDSIANVAVNATGIVPISTCCMVFAFPAVEGGVPTAASILVYADEDADPYAVAEAVDSYSPSGQVDSWGSSMAYYRNGGATASSTLISWLLVVLVCGGPVIALAVGVAARRRRDDATLAALGASRRTLSVAAVIETAAIAGVAVAAGLLGGALLQSAITVAARARDSLDGVITDSYLQVAVNAVRWDTLAWVFVGTVAAFAVVAWVVSLVGGQRRPVEQLRYAEAGRI